MIGYYIFRIVSFFIALLPFRLLYMFSDVLFFIFYYLVKYRRKIVRENLRNSFPEKTENDLKRISKKYYHNLCDLVVEVIKMQNMTYEKLISRIEINNAILLDDIYKTGKSVFIVTAHIGNWEWLGTGGLSQIKNYKVLASLKPINNKYFHQFMFKLRTKFGAQPEDAVHYKKILREMISRKNTQTISLLASDQSPSKSEVEYYTQFLNQDTPVFLGVEKMAKMLDLPVVYADTQRKARGKYIVNFKLLTDKPKETNEFEITNMHVKALEESICKHPDNWLWSHKRWKHARK